METEYKRCKNRIQDSGGHVKDYKSINAAKRESRKLGGFREVSVVSKLHDITGSTQMYKDEVPDMPSARTS